MKKFLSLVLALCLLCSAVALAETMTVTLNLKSAETTSDYVVSIPDRVELNYFHDDTPYASVDVYITAEITALAEGKKIEVSIAPEDVKTNEAGVKHFEVTGVEDPTDTIPYQIDCSYNGENLTSDTYRVIAFEEEKTYEQDDDVTLIILSTLENASAYTGLTSRSYTGTLTFNIAEVDK